MNARNTLFLFGYPHLSDWFKNKYVCTYKLL